MPEFSKELLALPEAANQAALRRIALAKQRVQSILDKQIVAHQKTLEQKIADQGPNNQRVDPHLVGLAIFDLLKQNRLVKHDPPGITSGAWYSNPGAPLDQIESRLETLTNLYESVSGHGFGNLTGDALELIVFKCLEEIRTKNPRYSYSGQFLLGEQKKDGRYRKISPPKHLNGLIITTEADFFQFGHEAGVLCIECKNLREWVYPHHEAIKELIIKAAGIDAIPVLVARRIHYTAISNFLAPAGIIAHESYFQYYPADQAEIASKVRDKNLLGFTDVLAVEEPHARTRRFFSEHLPKITHHMAAVWTKNKAVLLEYANDEINLPQLYTAIESPAGGKWADFSEAEEYPEY